MAVYHELWVPSLAFAALVGVLLLLRVYTRAKDKGPLSWRLRLLRLLLKEEQLPQVIRESLKPEPGFEVSPCSPVKVEWGGVHLTVDNSKRILTNCSGSAQPSRVTAIIGPSGAGKTSLMSALALRALRGDVKGTFLVNSAPRQNSSYARACVLVQQDDIFFPGLTVWETVQFHAGLYKTQADPTRPDMSPEKQRLQQAKALLQLMGLQKTMHSQIGGVLPGGLKLPGLSGGEKRRLSIVCAVVAGPSLVFLDEPTSGLDSYAALQVMQYLKKLADADHTVVLTIHQPEAAIWNLIDDLILLSEGYTLYYGPTELVRDWFQGLGYRFEADGAQTIYSWLLELVSIRFAKTASGQGDTTMHSAADVITAAGHFALHQAGGSPEGLSAKQLMDTAMSDNSWDMESGIKASRPSIDATPGQETAEISRKSKQAPAWVDAQPHRVKNLRQVQLLFWRAWTSYVRNPADVAGRLVVTAAVAVVIGLVFLGTPNTFSDVATRQAALADQLLILTLIPFAWMSLLTENRTHFIIELPSRLYSPGAYYTAVALANLPFSVMNAVVYSLIIYGLVGLRWQAAAIFKNLTIASLHHLISIQVLQTCGYILPNQDLATSASIAYIAICVELGGIFRPVFLLVRAVQDISYIAYIRYAIQGVFRAEVEDHTWPCLGSNTYSGPNYLPIANKSAVANDCAEDGIHGSQILEALHFHLGFWRIFAILMAFLLGLHFIAAAGLKLLQKRQASCR
ncbi:hypothetical protein WJX74_009839 [Apatococcus lobatus]|uniref:ABC transporter domain-containing protein n=1 Tax=Apatococcus lobatus TaxID=904363 RepID=A0AAW1QH57_9CHLO